jgi:hypothetical protein
MSVPQIYATRYGGLRQLEETVQLCFDSDEKQNDAAARSEAGDTISIMLATEEVDEGIVQAPALSRPLHPDAKTAGGQVSRTDSEGLRGHIRDYHREATGTGDSESKFGGGGGGSKVHTFNCMPGRRPAGVWSDARVCRCTAWFSTAVRPQLDIALFGR